MTQRRSRLDETPVFFPHPLAVEVARRFPAHWEFGAAWWSDAKEVRLSLGATGSIRVMWPRPDAHSWRVMFDRSAPYNLRRFDTLADLPSAAAEAIMAYVRRGRDWQERRRVLSAETLPTWLQVEIDRLMSPVKETTP